jgi:glycosyltransferase involved in cell wall biosynthesis
MLVGNGAKRKLLEQQASGIESIRFLDYQPREKLGESLSAADLHVVSMDEAITGCLAPSKLYGILASGTPVLAIVPKNNAVWRLVESERLGWCVEPGDQIGIVNAVHDARSRSSSELRDMGARGRALAEQLFDKNVCCSSFEEVIQELT